jgi:hypothetical protein
MPSVTMETLNRFAAGRELYSHVANPVPLGDSDYYEADSLVKKPEHKELVAALSKQLHSGWRTQMPCADLRRDDTVHGFDYRHWSIHSLVCSRAALTRKSREESGTCAVMNTNALSSVPIDSTSRHVIHPLTIEVKFGLSAQVDCVLLSGSCAGCPRVALAQQRTSLVGHSPNILSQCTLDGTVPIMASCQRILCTLFSLGQLLGSCCTGSHSINGPRTGTRVFILKYGTLSVTTQGRRTATKLSRELIRGKVLQQCSALVFPTT